MEKLIEFLEETMEVDEGTLNANTQLNDLEEWDSLTVLSLIIEAKENYGKIITTDDVEQFETVEDVYEFLNN